MTDRKLPVIYIATIPDGTIPATGIYTTSDPAPASVEYIPRSQAADELVRCRECELERAIELLHMLDNPDARHPDVAMFLDAYEERKARGE